MSIREICLLLSVLFWLHPGTASATVSDDVFFCMVASDDVVGVKASLEKGQDVNARTPEDDTALFIAAQNGSLAMTEALLTAGADANAINVHRKHTPLFVASRWIPSRSDPRVVEALIRAGANVNARDGEGKTPLFLPGIMVARFSENALRIVRLLLDAGADVNATDRQGTSPLMYAALGAFRVSDDSSLRHAKMLLDAGADLKATKKDAIYGETVLHH